jgi:ParB-like chromosome segregation protein Spo0J
MEKRLFPFFFCQMQDMIEQLEAGPWAVDDWPVGEERRLPLVSFGEVYRRYRLPDEAAEAAMARSMARDGQLSPSIVCLRQDRVEMVDGFKRLSVARRLGNWSSLLARRLDLDERGAKAAIYRLNQVARPTRELEEAWIVRALVREDGLSQVEVAELMGRHKSWICRRLALLERLADGCREEMALGLISPTLARQLTRLPAGNQPEAMAAARGAGLNAVETTGFVDLLVAAPSRPQVEYLLERPREALRQSKDLGVPSWDPRLTAAGNRVLKRLGYLIDALGRLETWFHQRGRADLSPGDRAVLAPTFSRLARDARTAAELCDDLLKEIDLP